MNRLDDCETVTYPRNKRRDRFICKDDAWYFTTRGEELQGPFLSREQAEAALEHYLTDNHAVVFNSPKVPPRRH